MERVAYIIGETFLYWNSIILLLAVLTAIFTFLAFYLSHGKNGIRAAVIVPVSMVLSVVLSRLVHWYCRVDAYESMEAAMTEFIGGGYALMGVFAGCLLTACLLRMVRIINNLPQTLDCMALGAGAGICVGRLACFFTSADRGMIVEGVRSLPWVYTVNNAVTGALEWRLATFMIQSLCAGGIFLAMAVFYCLGQRRNRRVKDGDTALLFLACYCATQVVLDSTRYDSLFLRSNGFISVVQILSAVVMGVVLIILSVRMVRATGFKWRYVGVWVLYAALLGGAGFMEYWVQRNGNQALFSYSVMSVCLVGMVAVTWVVWSIAAKGERLGIRGRKTEES